MPDSPALSLYNSWTRAQETFVPIDPACVRLYSCGPTVYNYAHLGNLRAYVFTDVLRRTLNWKNYAVNHVINITDVGHLTSDADEGEDKLELAAQREKRDIWAIAAHYTQVFKQDLKNLNILSPTLWSTATDHVQDMIAFAERLESQGYTYRLDEGLYFDTAKLDNYGYLARSDLAGQEDGARVAGPGGKRNTSDFAIWRSSPDGAQRQMEWLSPWGAGAPGWHLECSVMSMKYLGKQFDIHTGGIDHREIHHCNEIAQNQAYTTSENTGANWWMHNAFLIDRTGKMSKSKGGFLTLASIVDRGVSPLAYRLMCVSAHYRTDLEYTFENLVAQLTRLKRMVKRVEGLRAKAGDLPWLRSVSEIGYSRGAAFHYQRGDVELGLSAKARDVLATFDAAVSDDLMTPRALPILETVLDDKKMPPDEALRLIASMDLVLGLDLLRLSRRDLSVRPKGAALTDADVEERLEARQLARKEKDFARADAIRDDLTSSGVEIMDGDPLRWSWMPDMDSVPENL